VVVVALVSSGQKSLERTDRRQRRPKRWYQHRFSQSARSASASRLLKNAGVDGSVVAGKIRESERPEVRLLTLRPKNNATIVQVLVLSTLSKFVAYSSAKTRASVCRSADQQPKPWLPDNRRKTAGAGGMPDMGGNGRHGRHDVITLRGAFSPLC